MRCSEPRTVLMPSFRSMRISGDDYAGQTVNVVFSKGEQRVRTLLQKDGLVLSHNVYDEHRSEKGTTGWMGTIGTICTLFLRVLKSRTSW